VSEAEGRTVPLRAGGAAVAAVAVLFVLLVGGWLIGTRVHLVGTNSVAPRWSLPALTPGHRLCMRQLVLPADTNAIRLRLAAQPGASSPVALAVSFAGRTQVSHSSAPGDGTFGGQFRIAPPGREVLASACLTASRALVAESGMTSASRGTGEAFLDGKSIGALTVSYVRVPSRNLLSALPAGVHRASLFRAGFVGAWTYWVLAALMLVIWAVGLRLVVRGVR
jgi:hypothetical protein